MRRQRLLLAVPFLLVLLTATIAAVGRDSWPLDIDEAAHYLNAVKMANPLADRDVQGFIRAYTQEQGTIAPLGPALTAFSLAIGIGPVVAGSLVVLLAAVVLLLATRRLQRLACPADPSTLTVLFVAASAGVSLFLTVLAFALPSAACLAVVAVALVSSDGLVRRRWALLAGLVAGLALLSRAYNVATLPVLLVAYLGAFWPVIVAGGRRAAAGLAVAVAAGVVVVATWYPWSYRQVYQYLTSFGYGEGSAAYDRTSGVVDRIALRGGQLLADIGWIVGGAIAVLAVVAMTTRGQRRVDVRADRRVVAFLGAWLALGLLLLLTSENIGYGFTLPLLCPGLVLAVTACSVLARAPLPVWPGLLAVALSALVIIERDAVPTFPLEGREAFYAGLGMRTGLAHYYGDAHYPGGDEEEWLAANNAAADFASRPGGLVLAGTYPLLSTSSVHYFALSRRAVAVVASFDLDFCTKSAEVCAQALRSGPPGSVLAFAFRPVLGLPADAHVMTEALAQCQVVSSVGPVTFYDCRR